MPKKTLFDEICGALNFKLKEGEDIAAFSKRASGKVNGLKDPEWKELPDAVQKWTNKVLEAAENETDLPDLPGFPETASDEESSDVGEEAVDEAGDEAAEITAEEPAAEEASEDGGDGEEGDDAPDAEEVVDEPEVLGQKDAPTEAEDSPTPRREARKAGKPDKKAASKAPVNPKSGKGTTVTKVAAKKAAAPKESSGKRINEDQVITVVAKENPHRAGTKLHDYFKKYKSGMTVASAVKKGIPTKNIQYLQGLGHVKVA